MSSASHILLALLTLVLAAPAASAGAGETPARSVSVTGQGEASGRPDLAEINAGVQTFADTVVEASRENQAVVDRIFAALEQQGIEQDESPRLQDIASRTSSTSRSATLTGSARCSPP
jgi:uncharacterized protein YggE